MTFRRAVTFATFVTAGAAAMLLAGCTSSTPESTGAAAASPAGTTVAEASTSLPTPTAPPPSTCPEFQMTAAHMATDWQYLNLGLGTNNDEKPTLADLAWGVKAMQKLAPTCAPKAVDSIDAFAATVDAIQPVYTTQPTGDQVQTVNDGLMAMQKAGAQMFTDMGLSTYSWE